MTDWGYRKLPIGHETLVNRSNLLSPSRESEFSHAEHGSPRGTVLVSETFVSRQGEGILTGTDTYFIRLSGCNLRCWFCDTPYASWNPTGTKHPVADVAQAAVDSGLKHVVLTGGEPMLPARSINLATAIRAAGLHLTIETAGTIDREIECDLMSISPKLASSTPDAKEHPKWNRVHQQQRMPLETMRRLMDRSPQFQLKFVVDRKEDFGEVDQIVRALGVNGSDVWIMPQGSTIEAMDAALPWLKPWTQQQGYRYCERMQIRWFGNRRGT